MTHFFHHTIPPIVIPCGLTPVIRLCDQRINKAMKRWLKLFYMVRVLDQTSDDANGKT